MYDKNNPYKLRIENKDDTKHYYVNFIDVQGSLQEIEISESIYLEFRESEKRNKREQHFFDRHIEHSDLTDELLHNRALFPPKSVEENICDKEYYKTLWDAIYELPETQQRRFLLYYSSGFTYEKIANLENCTKRAIKSSVDIAREKILNKIKNF